MGRAVARRGRVRRARNQPSWTVVAARVGEEPECIWAVSLYGLWDEMDQSREIYAEATLHRALSDLTPLMQKKSAQRMIIAGDLNVWHGFKGKPWGARYKTVFDRLAAYELELVGPFRAEGAALDGCPCGSGANCRHVQTYRHQRKAGGMPFQNDYVFARGLEVKGCEALDDDASWSESDHCPVLVEVDPR